MRKQDPILVFPSPKRERFKAAAGMAALAMLSIFVWKGGALIPAPSIATSAVMASAPGITAQTLSNAANATWQSLAAKVGAPAPLNVLNDEDVARYRTMLLAQREGDVETARQLMQDVENPVLIGHIQGEHYLRNPRNTDAEELKAWLQKNADSPHAYDVYRLALAKIKAPSAGLVSIRKRPMLAGYGDNGGIGMTNRLKAVSQGEFESRPIAQNLWARAGQWLEGGQTDKVLQLLESQESNSLSAFEKDVLRWDAAARALYNGNTDSAYALAAASAARSGKNQPAMHWTAGIAAWMNSNPAAAARHFSAMADATRRISPWEQSAGAYWAWRAYRAIGNETLAARYLETAAAYNGTFYGILAARTLNRPLHTVQAPELGGTVRTALYSNDYVKRAIALSQIGENEAAESELRFAYPQARTREERIQLAVVANHLRLPSVQIAMSASLAKTGTRLDFAAYPTPDWDIAEHEDSIEPALLYAFSRQESGFHATAKSPDGAVGIMQLRPATARYVHNQLESPLVKNVALQHALMEPETNVKLGASYIAYLLRNPLIKGNMIYLAAAYNAGPGRLAQWSLNERTKNDPLLFMETIPYGETRRYVQQVLTGYWIYQSLNRAPITTLTTLSNGGWPVYGDMQTLLPEQQTANAGKP